MLRRVKKKIEDIPTPTEQELYYRMMEMPNPYKSNAAFMYLFGNRVSEALKDYQLIRAEIIEKDGFLIVNKIATLKREGRPFRMAYVDLNGEGEKVFADIIIEFINTLSPLQPIWTHSRKTQWYYCDKHLKIPPHKLRGMRATKDAVTYDLDAIDLKRKFNWKSDKMAMLYAAKNPSDIMGKIKKARKNEKNNS